MSAAAGCRTRRSATGPKAGCAGAGDLLAAHERLDPRGDAKLAGLLSPVTLEGRSPTRGRAKEAVRFLYHIPNPELAGRYLDELAVDLQDDTFPPEVRSLGRTLQRWRDQIVAWHPVRRGWHGPTADGTSPSSSPG